MIKHRTKLLILLSIFLIIGTITPIQADSPTMIRIELQTLQEGTHNYITQPNTHCWSDWNENGLIDIDQEIETLYNNGLGTSNSYELYYPGQDLFFLSLANGYYPQDSHRTIPTLLPSSDTDLIELPPIYLTKKGTINSSVISFDPHQIDILLKMNEPKTGFGTEDFIHWGNGLSYKGSGIVLSIPAKYQNTFYLSYYDLMILTPTNINYFLSFEPFFNDANDTSDRFTRISISIEQNDEVEIFITIYDYIEEFKYESGIFPLPNEPTYKYNMNWSEPEIKQPLILYADDLPQFHSTLDIESYDSAAPPDNWNEPNNKYDCPPAPFQFTEDNTINWTIIFTSPLIMSFMIKSLFFPKKQERPSSASSIFELPSYIEIKQKEPTSKVELEDDIHRSYETTTFDYVHTEPKTDNQDIKTTKYPIVTIPYLTASTEIIEESKITTYSCGQCAAPVKDPNIIQEHNILENPYFICKHCSVLNMIENNHHQETKTQ